MKYRRQLAITRVKIYSNKNLILKFFAHIPQQHSATLTETQWTRQQNIPKNCKKKKLNFGIRTQNKPKKKLKAYGERQKTTKQHSQLERAE